ncbi:hypothetical protein IFM89_019591 [Coptis chinensis]|uniref:RING-type domain-containing protein n=1 Tax=Coptis chinensis TaxID=261450 RepID=A0A835ICZ8_9MAGN|nr:hypothetical protein IFM89_019591 [Coptis chinensis]
MEAAIEEEEEEVSMFEPFRAKTFQSYDFNVEFSDYDPNIPESEKKPVEAILQVHVDSVDLITTRTSENYVFIEQRSDSTTTENFNLDFPLLNALERCEVLFKYHCNKYASEDVISPAAWEILCATLPRSMHINAWRASNQQGRIKSMTIRLVFKVVNILMLPYVLFDGMFDTSPQCPLLSAASSAVASLETRKYVEKENSEEGSCPVCLDEFCEGIEVTLMPCKHVFHNGCIKEWLQTNHTCPLCRHELPLSSGASEEEEEC